MNLPNSGFENAKVEKNILSTMPIYFDSENKVFSLVPCIEIKLVKNLQ